METLRVEVLRVWGIGTYQVLGVETFRVDCRCGVTVDSVDRSSTRHSRVLQTRVKSHSPVFGIRDQYMHNLSLSLSLSLSLPPSLSRVRGLGVGARGRVVSGESEGIGVSW